MNVIQKGNVKLFAAVRDEELKGPVKAVLLTLHGLNYIDMNPPASDFDRECAGLGILPVFPYHGAWGWMNDTSVKLIDQVVDAVYDKYEVDPSAPLIISGGSMGGLGSLMYARYAKRTPVACAADSPVCDLPYHYTEREDLPRTLFSAFEHYHMDLTEAMKTASPLHQVANMPDIPYFIVHGTADIAVNKQAHSDRFVEQLKKNHQVEYLEVEGMEHCSMPGDIFQKYREFIFQHAGLSQAL